jgi:hypothetical protein
VQRKEGREERTEEKQNIYKEVDENVIDSKNEKKGTEKDRKK